MSQPPTTSAVENTRSAVSELRVAGMTCNNCARHVTEALQSVPGVRSASVLLDAERASVRWTAGTAPDIASLLEAVKQAGFAARVIEAASGRDEKEAHAGWHLNLWLGVIATLPLMAGEWIFSLGLKPWFQWFSFALAGVVQVVAGAQFYRGAWRQLKLGRSNMDTLVALGSSTAFGYSTWALLSGQGGHVYFMEAAAIITLISVGHWLEARVSERASGALKSLLQLAPQTARRLGTPVSDPARSGSSFNLRDAKFIPSAVVPIVESEVPVAELNSGDLLALRPGDRVPVDGVVLEGDSAVDESMLTGESVPVDKSSQHKVYAGTVNVNGRLVMRVTATGEATALANIIAAVQRAQTSRANIQRLGDRVSSVFVPVVVLVAIAAGLWWGFAPDSADQVHNWFARFLWPAHPPRGQFAAAFIIAAAVLIIACPCAMGLATPAAIMAGANAAARRGILIRDGVALEKAGRVTAVIFDKTGTLTSGKPEVVSISEVYAQPDEERMLADQVKATAAALARHSTHPLSLAVGKVATAEARFTDWQEVRGAGVQGRLNLPGGEPQTARLGSVRWLQEIGVDVSSGDRFISEWSAQAATIVGFATGTSLRVLFAVKDALKPGAAKVVAQLQRQGLKTHLLTGDNPLTASTIAQQIGIAGENVFAEVRPEQKAEFVKRLQQRGERVAFVGDGINDAPALEQADLGIAVSRASDVAREAADIILLKSEIEAVPEALGLARATLRTIKQNLFWAFFYNALGVPLAALGFMSPVLCAAAMGFSDLIVIGNALRLRWWRS
ncbi:MAG: cation-translocating P-type ATPase [Verrucomicrobia bacterium]|nr:cation-translocating P-type ATPase [Verrucomicrobiota bacterium]